MTTTLYIPSTTETDPKKQNKSIAVIGSQTATNTDAIATNTTAIATANTNITSLQTTVASSSTFGLAKVDGTTIKATAGVIATVTPLPTPITASLGADVALNNTANYFDGPSIAQGSTGTWFVSGTVSLVDTVGTAVMFCKLWDGTTVIASGSHFAPAATATITVTLSGYLASPAGNLRISCRDSSRTSEKVPF